MIPNEKVTGFTFSPLNKRIKPFVVYSCHPNNDGLTFSSLIDAKKYIMEKKGESFCTSPFIKKITHDVKVTPKNVKVNEKYVKGIFFGWAPS
jgi:hypothetical protein